MRPHSARANAVYFASRAETVEAELRDARRQLGRALELDDAPDDAHEELGVSSLPIPARPERSESQVLTWRCATCHGEWTLEGSHADDACTRCHTPRPAGA